MNARDADAIRRLLHAYGDAVLAHDEAAWGALWTEDAVWELGPDRTIEGRATIVDHWRTSIANYRHVVQLYLSSTATVDGDDATGRAYFVELNVPVDGDRRVLPRSTTTPTGAPPAGGCSPAARSSGSTPARPISPGSSSAPTPRSDRIRSDTSVERPRQLVGLTRGEHHPPGRERVAEQVDGRVP